MEQCSGHATLDKKISSIETSMADICASIRVMSKTMLKLEDNSLQIAALQIEVVSIFKIFDKAEKERDELFDRVRALEDIGANPRLRKIEASQGACSTLQDVKARQDKVLLGGVLAVIIALIGTVLKVTWK